MKAKYRVNFDMRWSHDVVVSAKTATEAKKLAFETFKKKVKRNMFSVDAEKEPNY